jgi:hypothetical protein
MNPLIYLDQNILSDLRQRKIEESHSKEFTLLKNALTSEQITVVYSHITLGEILQIPKEIYREEHIELLSELDAKYIEPLHRTLSDQAPSIVWHAHLDNEKSNEEMGIVDLIKVSQLSSRKFSGLPVEESFQDINDLLKKSLHELISNCEQQLSSVNTEQLNEPLKTHFENMHEKLPELKAKAESLKAPTVDKKQQLGIKLFREIPEVKALKVRTLKPHLVVSAIESIFKMENSNFNLYDYFEDTPQNAVARAYSLMNWAGYYADDFTKLKKGFDRFNASNNDMQHVVSAFDINFLISNDINFCKKAEACFAYISSKTIVCSSLIFIEKFCKFV